MSEGYQGGGGGEEERQVVVVRGGGGGGEGGGWLPFYHVPQQSRREKLRYPNTDEPPLHHPPPPPLVHHYNPLTTTFMSPSSSSSYNLLNPSYSATPYDHATPFLRRDHFLDQSPLFNHHQGQGVSLSLSSSSTHDHHHHGHQFDAPVLGGPSPLAALRAPVPAGPFTGYATILKVSRFLRPAQQLLEEVCDVGGVVGRGELVCGVDESETLDLTAAEGVSECGVFVDGSISGESGEHRRVKTRLVSMLDEVYRRYKQYYQQIRSVIASFESVSGLSTAAPYTSLALKSMSKHFHCLKNAISDQLQFTKKAPLGKECHSKEEIPGFRLINGGLCYQKAASNQQHVWRPQRGLPERAVAVLRAWLFEHFLHPYPTDIDKQMLARQTGLSRNQVSNWFINARVRLWKPMVEEIHSLETRQTLKVPEADKSHNSNKQPQLPTASSADFPTNKRTPPNTRSRKTPDPSPNKRFRNEITQIPNHIEEPLNLSFNDLSSHHRSGVGNGGVSLTLGLHQNNGICLSEPLPLNVVRRFGLEESNAAYVMGGFDGHHRHFGKDIDGQLFHDFVG